MFSHDLVSTTLCMCIIHKVRVPKDVDREAVVPMNDIHIIILWISNTKIGMCFIHVACLLTNQEIYRMTVSSPH
jgi:hypothetical protein